jgi:hypothetical protein
MTFRLCPLVALFGAFGLKTQKMIAGFKGDRRQGVDRRRLASICDGSDSHLLGGSGCPAFARCRHTRYRGLRRRGPDKQHRGCSCAVDKSSSNYPVRKSDHPRPALQAIAVSSHQSCLHKDGNAAQERHFAAHPEDRDANIVIFEFYKDEGRADEALPLKVLRSLD